MPTRLEPSCGLTEKEMRAIATERPSNRGLNGKDISLETTANGCPSFSC